MDAAITVFQPDGFQAVIQLVTDSHNSENSKRAYEEALTDFLHWWHGMGRPTLSKALVQRYKTILANSGLAPATVNQRLCAIRKLAQEAADLFIQAVSNTSAPYPC
jgi:site-specific recombinase XerD